MVIITLTTDFGESEVYTATLKGELLSNCEGINIVDISHKIRRNNVPQAAFMVRYTYSFYPSKSIHFVLVGDFDVKGCYWITKVDSHFFITKNFTTISLLFSSTEKAVMVTRMSHTMKYFELVKMIVSQESALPFDATLFNTRCQSTFPQPVLIQENNETKIKGHVLYFTVNGDAITNITQELFSQTQKPFKVMYINSKEHCIYEVTEEEHKIQDGKLYAHFNIYGLLELSMKNTSIRQFLGLELISSTVTLLFDL